LEIEGAVIQYDSKIWFSFLFNFRSGQLRKLLPNMAIMAAFTSLVCFLDLNLALYKLEMPLTIHTLLGVVLGLVLVFRTNTAYERWWEGRKLLGALVNSSRNLAIKLDAFLDSGAFRERHQFASLISSFVLILPSHLRDSISDDAVNQLDATYRDQIASAAHKPIAIMKILFNEVQSFRAKGILNIEQFLSLSQNLNEMIDAIGGMERIKKTPIPFSYSLLIKRFIAAYVFSLPFGLVHDFRWASAIIVPFVFYVMVGIEVIAESIENPFGTDADDLPTEDIAQNITRNVKEILSSAYGEIVKEKMEGESLEQTDFAEKESRAVSSKA
jgi:putative membrane protein